MIVHPFLYMHSLVKCIQPLHWWFQPPRFPTYEKLYNINLACQSHLSGGLIINHKCLPYIELDEAGAPSPYVLWYQHVTAFTLCQIKIPRQRTANGGFNTGLTK